MKKAAAFILTFLMVISLVACSGKNPTVQDYLEQPEVKSQIETLCDQMANSGIDVKVTGEDNKLIYTYTFDVQVDDVEQAKSALEAGLASQEATFTNIAKTLKEEVKINDPIVVLEYLNADGSEILVQEFKAE